MWNRFSAELIEHRYIGSAICPEYPTKDWRGKPSWLNPRKSVPEVIKGQGRIKVVWGLWLKLTKGPFPYK